MEPGDAEGSILMERITSDDPDEKMPPPDEHPEGLSDFEIDLLRRWIDEGASWDSIWSLGGLIDPVVESTKTPTSWSRNRLDRLVWNRLSKAKMKPSREAPAVQWFRRVSFDLTGLPPQPVQTQAFRAKLEDVSNNGETEEIYGWAVDQLLASESFGERWAAVWMDLARYADSQGFEKDPHRDMWPYRNWLIDAFNADMPYDEFTIKQLAGDLLDNPTASDVIATAFHRNTQTNTEGGTDDEEFRIAAIIDRVSTTWTVWQATTMGCVQCHSHPYDPIDHDEFYASLALFNNTMDWDLADDFPYVKIPNDPSQRDAAFEVYTRYNAALHDRNALGRDLIEELNWLSLQPQSIESTGGKLVIEDDFIRSDGGTFPSGVVFIAEYSSSSDDAISPKAVGPITAIKVEIDPLSSDPKSWPEQGAMITRIKLFAKTLGEEVRDEVKIADVFVDGITMRNDPRDVLRDNATGVGSFPKIDRPRRAVFVLKEPLDLQVDQRLVVEMTHRASTPGGGATPVRRFRYLATSDKEPIDRIGSDPFKDADAQCREAKQAWDQLGGAKLPVMRSRNEDMHRPTYHFIRGNWLERGDAVKPGVPRMFTGDSQPVIHDRLDFAKWLVSDENPVAARVWANRVWTQLFGIGLVETLEDFGSSGQQPVDSGLLDHLAIAIRDRHDWRLKPFLKELVLSATYRQDHSASKELIAQDPKNRWLARGPRTRLSAEMIRDQALAISGLLHHQIGGPSVMPPQPDGVWQAVYSGMKWKTAEGEQRYRRGVYTYWRRTSPYPSLMMFDAPTRDLCSARRIATNTPLQALVTLNDPVYVDCSRELARRAMRESPDTSVEAVVAWIMEAVTQQAADEADVAELVALYNDLGHSTRSGDTTEISETALRIVAMMVLNWDKALTK